MGYPTWAGRLRGCLGAFLLTLLGAALWVVPVFAVTLRRGPLLQNPEDDPSTATLVWWTDVPGDSTVRFGLDPDRLAATVQGKAGLHHEVSLEGLPAGATCYYALETGGQVLWSDAFVTAPGPHPNRPIVFTVIGDFGVQSREHRDHIKQIERLKPDFVMTVGDNAYEQGEQSEVDENWLGLWRLLVPRTFVYPTLGNHDVKIHGGRAYFNTWVLPHNNPDKTERYYSFNFGPIHCVVLDSNQPNSREQSQWLRKDLAGCTASWKFVFLHHSPYSCGGFHGSSLEVRKAWSALFEAYGVDVVFSGHDHNYQRSRLIDDYKAGGLPGPDGKGTTYIVTGGGGSNLDEVSGCGYTKVAKSVYEFIKVTLEDRRALLEAIDPDGHLEDRFEINKGR